MSDLKVFGKYALTVIAIMSGIFSLVREVLQFIDPEKYPEKSLFFACLRAACLISVVLLWWQERVARHQAEIDLDDSKPKLVLRAGNIVWIYRAVENLTVIFINASVVNRGAPTVTLSWKARYIIGSSTESMELYNIRDSYSLDLLGERLILTNDDLINLKTLETPIQKGQFIGGRLMFVLPGDRNDQMKSLQHKIQIECQDYLGQIYTEMYEPSSQPLTSLKTHYKEKRQLLVVEDEASKLPALTSNTPAQEPPPSS